MQRRGRWGAWERASLEWLGIYRGVPVTAGYSDQSEERVQVRAACPGVTESVEEDESPKGRDVE